MTTGSQTAYCPARSKVPIPTASCSVAVTRKIVMTCDAVWSCRNFPVFLVTWCFPPQSMREMKMDTDLRSSDMLHSVYWQFVADVS
jgi:hypothetical protein